MEIPKNIKDEIWEYCRLNDITDIDSFILNSLQQGFNIEKYGATPFKINQKESEIVEKEVIKEIEVIKEVLVEVIREVEKEVIKEVTVEKIVEVEKEVYITDDDQVEELRNKLIESQLDATKYLSGWENKLDELKAKEIEIGGLNKTIIEYQKTVSHNEVISESEEILRLEKSISNLEIELELEKNRNFVPEKKKPIEGEKPRRLRLGNIINWVPKKDDEIDDFYKD